MTNRGGNQGHDAAGRLDVGQDLRFSARAWRVERIGWWAMTLAVGAALLGGFGNGPLSWRKVGEPGGPLKLEYERFIRTQAPVVLRLRVGPGAADADGLVRLSVSRGYLESFKFEQLTPEPESVTAGPDRTVFVLRVADRDEPVEVVARLEAETVGSVRGVIGLEGSEGAGGARLEFSQFAYP